jgi:2-deoxy-D-gluconate 3-dehydrogenase
MTPVLDFRLDGRTALVTGASRGLGRAIADALHELGATVYGTSRDGDSAVRIAERYGTAPVRLDIGDLEATTDAVGALFAGGAGIDLLVNNAGMNIPEPAVSVTADSWDAIYAVNVRSVFFLSQAVAKEWIARGTRGAMVNVGSQAGSVAIENRAAYGSSKGAITQLTRNLAYEWAPRGIRVNAVAPTFVRTELTASTLAESGFAEELLKRIPLGRWGEPEEVASAVAFLLGDGASLITGHTLMADGGYSIH